MRGDFVDGNVAWKRRFASLFSDERLRFFAEVDDWHAFPNGSPHLFSNFAGDFSGALIFLESFFRYCHSLARKSL